MIAANSVTVQTVGTAPLSMPSGPSAPAAPAYPGLPEPLLRGADPQDALAMMLLTMERMSQASTSETQARIAETRSSVREQLTEYLDKVKEAIAAARAAAAAEDDDGGWLSDVVDTVADAVGEVVGTLTDLQVDAVTMPFDLAVSFVKNPGDMQAMLSTMQTELLDLTRNGETAESVKGFTKGTINVCAAAATFVAKLQVAIAKAAVTGESVWEGVKKEAVGLWKSFEKNILNNPGFWEVASAVGKAALIAGATVAGGPLGTAAVVLLLANEADNRYGFIEKLAGDKAPWIKMGLQIAGMVCAGAAGGDLGTTAKLLQAGVAAAAGAKDIYEGYRGIQEANRKADDLDRQADIQSTLNRMQRLQRLLEDLIALLQEKSERNTTTHEIGNELVQTQAAMQTAAIMRA